MYNSGLMRLAAILLLVCLGLSAVTAAAPPYRKHVSVWLIPAENAGPNDIAQGENIPSRLEALRASLESTHIRLLNVEDPLAMKARSWNPEFTVPNFQVVDRQTKTIAALQRFAEQNQVEITVRFVTWDEAFGLLSANRAEGPDALPDVFQVGTTWAAYLATSHLIRSRPDWQSKRGNWRDVAGVPASALPYTNDIRLLFYWKRLPSAPPETRPFSLNGSSWEAVLTSLRNGTESGETAAFATGLTLNLLHDYAALVWSGGHQELISKTLVGPSINLADDDALAVPTYLATHTRVRLGNGDYRRLIAFPESSHEEVVRTFVNGGYRVTLEPANFIDRWAEDFNERQARRQRVGNPRQRFWDYAAAVVPPATYKGGSELVVSPRAADPELAFSLADYLATDPLYTEVLAQAGQLPSGRPGYGIDSLVRALDSKQDEPSVRAFREAVQKAIDQGHEYPELATWPMVFENRLVLEKLQRVWRRMAEGDVQGMREATREVDWEINSQIYGPSRAKRILLDSWPFLLFAALSLGGYAGWIYRQRGRSRQRLTTLLHLYRASRHESVKILGDNLRGLAERSRTGTLDQSQLTESLGKLACHYALNLAPHMQTLGADLVREVQSDTSPPARLSTIVSRARDGAMLHYQAVKLMRRPDVSFASEDLDSWVLERYSSMATVILQEWFYNCLKELTGSQPIIIARMVGHTLTIVSSGRLSDQDRDTLTGKPSTGTLMPDAHGLVLVRDIAYNAFGARVRVEQDGMDIHLSVPLPVRRVSRNVHE